jgi:hypothetical protein
VNVGSIAKFHVVVPGAAGFLTDILVFNGSTEE